METGLEPLEGAGLGEDGWGRERRQRGDGERDQERDGRGQGRECRWEPKLRHEGGVD